MVFLDCSQRWEIIIFPIKKGFSLRLLNKYFHLNPKLGIYCYYVIHMFKLTWICYKNVIDFPWTSMITPYTGNSHPSSNLNLVFSTFCFYFDFNWRQPPFLLSIVCNSTQHIFFVTLWSSSRLSSSLAGERTFLWLLKKWVNDQKEKDWVTLLST